MTTTCPLCGRTLEPAPVRWLPEERCVSGRGHVVELTPQEARIFDVLWKRRGTAVDVSTIIDACYADDPDGGPEYARNGVHKCLHVLRPRLAPLGITVTATHPGRGALYRMVVAP